MADRLFGVLEYLAEHGPSRLNEIAEAAGLNKTTCYRVISSLEYMGYAEQTEPGGVYSLTFKVVDVANRYLEGIDVISMTRPALTALMQETGETVHLVIRDHGDIVYIDKVESTRNNVRMVSRVGSRIPFYRSAVGKALASSMGEEQVRSLWQSCVIERKTDRTITDYSRFLAEVDEARKLGFALDREENEPGVTCIGAALTIGGDAARYAFSVSVPTGRLDAERMELLTRKVLETREALNASFGTGTNRHQAGSGKE